MKKVGLLLIILLIATFAFAQKKGKEPVKVKGDTARLELTAYNIEVLSGLIKRANGLNAQMNPIQKQLNIVDSTYSAIIKTRLDGAGYDPAKGRYGIVGNEILYIPNPVDSSKLKLQSAGSSNLAKPK